MMNILIRRIGRHRIHVKKHGLTLIELMVSLALLGILLLAVYSFFGASNKFFGLTDRRADAQTQLTMIMKGLKSEVSTSGYVQIAGDTRLSGAVESVYYGGEFNGEHTLLVESGGTINTAFSNMPLDGFTITYSYNTSKSKILTVTMTTSEGYSLSGDILSPNIDITVEITGNTSGSRLVLIPAQ